MSTLTISAPGTPNYDDRGTYLTQAKIPNTPQTPSIDLYQYTLFAQDSVKRLTGSDFGLNSKELITLNNNDCVIVLFYTENKESLELCKIWGIVAQQVPGPTFAACNLIIEKQVAEAFTKIKGNGSHAFNWAALKGLPFILVYRSGWPVAFYNGERSVQAIVDYSLTLACDAGYFETKQNGGGMVAQAQLEMTGIQTYGGKNVSEKKESTDFKTTQPVRGYNVQTGLARTGTTEQVQAAQAINQERAASQGQTGVSQTEETVTQLPTPTTPTEQAT